MSTAGRIHQLSVSHGGVPKRAVLEARVDEAGIEGDRQRNRRLHGGPRRALCLYSLEQIETFAAEGHPIGPGSAGENVTVSGLDWALVTPGTRLRLGEGVEIEVTAYTTPCVNNARWFLDGDFNRMHQRRQPGASRVYARVLAPGVLRPGDRVEVLTAVDARRLS